MQKICSNNWFELTPTMKAGVKHCDTCNKEVFLCLEQDELTERIAGGVCVVYFIEPNRQTRFTLAKEKLKPTSETLTSNPK
jgi:hypothetical protein